MNNTSATMEGSEKDIVANLRAIIISSKGGLKLSEVTVDYKEAFGSDIPLKSLGCHTIKNFFDKYPNDFKVLNNKVQAITKASSSHIVDLITKQKGGKKSGRTKLATKQDLSFRKPTIPNGQSKNFVYSIPVKSSRQSFKEHQTNASKLLPQMVNIKKTFNNNTIVEVVKTGDKISNPLPALMDLNLDVKNIPFTNIEDYSGTLASHLRSAKTKNSAAKGNGNVGSGTEAPPSLRSPFRLSLSFLNNKRKHGPAVSECTSPVKSPVETPQKEFESGQPGTKGNVCESEYVRRLRESCANKNLPAPVFKLMECHPKNQPKYFICKVRIGEDILLSSYPFEALDECSAKDLASIKACDHIENLNAVGKANSGNEAETLSRLYDMIKSKEYGVWHSKLRNLYLETYKEEIQQDWFEMVKKSPKFEITTVENVGFIIRTTNCPNVTEVPTLASLKYPDSNQWEVYVTNAVSSAEVWCRLIGKEYSEAYDSMMTKLELHPPNTNVASPVVDGIYVVNIEESWNRVKVVEVSPEKNEISVFLIDIGFYETVNKSQLFELPKKFFAVAPQAILVTLNELDCLAESEELKAAMLTLLLGNTFIAEVVIMFNDGKNVSSVILWDTSTAEDINVNVKLLDHVVRSIKSPVLPTIGIVKEMFVSHVDDNGDIYFQESKQNSNFLEWIISTKIKYSPSLVSLVSRQIEPMKLYVTRSAKTGLFYRAKLVKIIDSNSVLMKFIDYGYEQQTSVDDLLDLEQTAIDLATIPSQAIRTKLNSLKNLSSKILDVIRDNILEQNVLVKVSKVPVGSFPFVEILKRSQTDGTLSSINRIIENTDKNKIALDISPRKKSFVVGSEVWTKNLPMPNIPPVGSYFTVFVTLAAHPGLFNVQPVSSQRELMDLMNRLQGKCEKSFSKPLLPEDFKIGELYAVKYSDNTWYRAYAHASTGSSMFFVCLCDFGDIVEASAEKLMPLPGEFKMFPYQAIRAYLAGIEPMEKDWTALDCVKFRELVVEKQFVSQIIEVNRDVKNPNFISLGLILVDTSTSEDIYIHKVLIDQKMAVLKC